MTIGLLKEIKSSEQRILLIPSDVEALVEAGHDVFIESGAGTYSRFDDGAYESVGAKILPTSEKLFQNVELVLKVQAPMPVEYELYLPDHIGFSFLYLPNNAERLKALLKRKGTFFAAEMFQNSEDTQPILNSMSEIAGMIGCTKMSVSMNVSRLTNLKIINLAPYKRGSSRRIWLNRKDYPVWVNAVLVKLGHVTINI